MSTHLNEKEIEKLRSINFAQQNGFVDAESVLSQTVGVQGSEQRNEFNAKAQAWYYVRY